MLKPCRCYVSCMVPSLVLSLLIWWLSPPYVLWQLSSFSFELLH